MAGLDDVILHWLHILFVAIWVGGLASLLAAYRVEGFKTVYRAMARLMVASLVLVAVSGLLLASHEYREPSAWFDFGSPLGRIGEKIVTFILIAVVMGYTHHSISRRGYITSREALMAGLVFLLSLGAMALGVMLALD